VIQDDLCQDLKPLTRQQRVEMFRVIYAARRIDDREIAGKRQNKVFFQINGVGHEAVQAAALQCLRPGHDWFFLYYRDRALAYGLGITAQDMFLGSVGSKLDPATGGRQMPNHWTSRELHIFPCSSTTGTQMLEAVGAAEAIQRAEKEGLTERLDMKSDEIIFATIGDGACSEGEFWETINVATNLKLPMVILVEDNGFAISTPSSVQFAGGNVAALLKGWEAQGLLVLDDVDGCDPLDSYIALQRAVCYARCRRGPALVRAKVVRPYSHSLSDDEHLYKLPEEIDEEWRRDPVATYAAKLLELGDITPADLDALKAAVQAEVDAAWAVAEGAPPPDPTTLCDYLYSSECDPCSVDFDTEDSFPRQEGGNRTLIDLVNSTLRQEMARDERILVFGEDVADAREEIMDRVKGKGGVFKATHGLQRQFGANRVFNTPIAEAAIIGRAIGLSVRGFKPVAEIQFFDYIWPAMQQLRDELATLRWRCNNAFKTPMVVRVPSGGYLMGGGVYHSQSGESIFAHIPGLRVVCPSTALDAAGLLRTALRCDDPVLFLEPKHLYRQTHNKSFEPGPDFMIPFGKARVVQEGTDLSVITFGNTVHYAQQAAWKAAEEGLSIELIDLRSLNPYDWDAIVKTVTKTHRVLVAHEDTQSWGYGAEIAARIADELFFQLDAPVKRLAAPDTWVGYHPDLEDATLPQAKDFLEAYRRLAAL